MSSNLDFHSDTTAIQDCAKVVDKKTQLKKNDLNINTLVTHI